MADIVAEKKALRREFLKKRREISDSIRVEADNKVCNELFNICENELKPEMVAAYISDGTEVDLSEFISRLIADGVRVCVPRFNLESKTGEYEMVEIMDIHKDLKLGHYDIMEPVDTCPALSKDLYNKLLWLVPGVAFDEKCGRLGRGKGVYDRLIESYDGISIGIFYECQKTAAVPMAEHDRKLDLIVSEKGVYRQLNDG